MGLSRNKVAVPEGAAGTPPFWRDVFFVVFVIEDENTSFFVFDEMQRKALFLWYPFSCTYLCLFFIRDAEGTTSPRLFAVCGFVLLTVL